MSRCIRLTFLRLSSALFCFFILSFGTLADVQAEAPRMLTQVHVAGTLESLGIPVYAHLMDAAGQEYVLTFAPLQELRQRKLSYRILDDAGALKQDARYLLAYERRQGARQYASGVVTVVFDDGRQLLARATPSEAERLANLGFEFTWLRERPQILRAPEKVLAKAITPHPLIHNLLTQVTQSHVSAYTGRLSGETPAIIGGTSYTITTRHTKSGTSIQKATQYVYEHMHALGLTVRYQNWTTFGSSGRNVIGELRGTIRPGEIVLMTAHLDNLPSSGLAPGADDNASGSVAVMLAAELMSPHRFERTVRFVFFTGEEQGLFGSEAYAESVYAANENIVAVYNMDMIAWDSLGGPVLRLHTRLPSNPGYPGDLSIAQLLTEVIANYGLNSSLTPIITSKGEMASDHASFWGYGYAALLMIEDDYNDFNPYYHTRNDTLNRLNIPYFTAMVKASVGSVAHLAVPTGEPGNSYLLWAK